MPYTPHTWVDNETITDALLNNLESGVERANKAATGPFSDDFGSTMYFRLRPSPGALSYGGVSSAGDFTFTPGGNTWMRPASADAVDTTALSTDTIYTLAFNKVYILPAHVACSVKGLAWGLSIGVALGPGGGSVTLQRYEVILVKINGSGVETTLNTTTITATVGYRDNSHSRAVGAGTYGGAANIASPISIASGERLAIRVKIYGQAMSASIVGLNIDGGTYSAPTANQALASMFALKFS